MLAEVRGLPFNGICQLQVEEEPLCEPGALAYPRLSPMIDSEAETASGTTETRGRDVDWTVVETY